MFTESRNSQSHADFEQLGIGDAIMLSNLLPFCSSSIDLLADFAKSVTRSNYIGFFFFYNRFWFVVNIFSCIFYERSFIFLFISNGYGSLGT